MMTLKLRGKNGDRDFRVAVNPLHIKYISEDNEYKKTATIHFNNGSVLDVVEDFDFVVSAMEEMYRSMYE